MGLPVFRGGAREGPALEEHHLTAATLQAQIYDPAGALDAGYLDRRSSRSPSSRRPRSAEAGRLGQLPSGPDHEGPAASGHHRSRECRPRRRHGEDGASDTGDVAQGRRSTQPINSRLMTSTPTCGGGCHPGASRPPAPTHRRPSGAKW
jgi:hypothetical protein